MSEIKQPADRKSKVVKFSFKDAAGKSHTLPLASAGAEQVPGRITRDAIMGGEGDEMAQMRLGFALLDACGADAVVIDALYSLPTGEMAEIIGDWMRHGDGSGAEVPQS